MTAGVFDIVAQRWDVLRGSGHPRRVRPGAIAALMVLTVVGVAAVAPTLLTGTDPLAVSPADRLAGPSTVHLFGTDQLGRDVFARMVHGAAASLSAAGVAVGIAVVIGGLIGVTAGFYGRWPDRIAMRGIDVLLAVPGLLLSLALIAATGGGTVQVGVAVGIAGIAPVARIVRARTHQVRSAPFVEAASVSGWRTPTVVARHVIPHLWSTLVAVASAEFGQAVLAIAALGFLGFGPPPPAPEWGAMIADGRAFMADSWWLTLLPAIVITAVVLSAYRASTIWGDSRDS